ncbi:hypothetical protein B296_00031675 [Ensete ventricosum]|uniref:BRCT domain-containing protein n=1 Tax=Ensete ventricosum TaxID=4639 RepID=A0A427AD60_ENSVE|nr:hypothetical protein B296_00031675 [Ensete ventricosum]
MTSKSPSPSNPRKRNCRSDPSRTRNPRESGRNAPKKSPFADVGRHPHPLFILRGLPFPCLPSFLIAPRLISLAATWRSRIESFVNSSTPAPPPLGKEYLAGFQSSLTDSRCLPVRCFRFSSVCCHRCLQELRVFMLRHGGRYENYFSRRSVTHIICSHLPDSKMRNFRLSLRNAPNWISLSSQLSSSLLNMFLDVMVVEFELSFLWFRAFSRGLPVVRPAWVVDSVAANKLLSCNCLYT